VTDWVWSPEPVHEALVDLETFIQAQDVSVRRERSRTAPGPSRHSPATRICRLRSCLFCGLCGRRMFGNSKCQVTWYACVPKKQYRPGGHPVVLRVREDHLLDGLASILAEKVFGPHRHALLDAEQAALAQAARNEHARTVNALRRAITDTDTKGKRLIRNLELAGDLDQDLLRDTQERRGPNCAPGRPGTPARRGRGTSTPGSPSRPSRPARPPAGHDPRPGRPARRDNLPALRSTPAANPLRPRTPARDLPYHPQREHDRRSIRDQPGSGARAGARSSHPGRDAAI
jgi:hypothetical protein